MNKPEKSIFLLYSLIAGAVLGTAFFNWKTRQEQIATNDKLKARIEQLEADVELLAKEWAAVFGDVP
jgi:hypothetical protein